MRNILCIGDSIQIMKNLEKNSIDLIYLDPPFFTKRSHESLSYDGKRLNFDDIWKDGLTEYLEFLEQIFKESLRLVKKSGSVFVHCDWHAVHYLKIELDKIFGYHNFRNEIIWKRHNSQNNNKQGAKLFGRMHDSILVYSKSKDYYWDQPYENYSEEYITRTYKCVEKKTGRKYALGDLSGPGGSSKGNPFYEFMGFTQYWRYNKEKMIHLFKNGQIVQTKKGTLPKLKRYLDEMQGIPINDLWNDIPSDQTTKKKSVYYPTQKPLLLLQRIIECSTPKNGLILDPFCGSGTTLVCAEKLGRKWIGIDTNSVAIKTSQQRLKENNITDYDWASSNPYHIIV